MNRRTFLGSSLGAVIAGNAPLNTFLQEAQASSSASAGSTSINNNPSSVKLNIKPVMTALIHTDVWEGPCRFNVVTPCEEEAQVVKTFQKFVNDIKNNRFPFNRGDVNIFEPNLITFSEDFSLKEEQLNKLDRDSREIDAYFIKPDGASIATFEIASRYNKPVILLGLSCRTVDIAAYSRSKGQQVLVPNNKDELGKLIYLLRAKKVFNKTRVLFPTERGLPPVASIASINDPQELEARFGITVMRISYQELTEEVDRVMSGKTERKHAEEFADRLIRNSRQSYLESKYVAASIQFYQTVINLMNRYDCNAFTIECFEFCSSRLPEKWKITPCLIHTLLKDQGFASSCEADFGALLSMRLLMSVSGKSSHLGNVFLRRENILEINHSAPGTRMNGYNRPALPYKLGRFTDCGWGTKAVVDFMNNNEKKITAVRINPLATKMLVLRGTLVGAGGWDKDHLGCSVAAHIKPLNSGDSEEFIRKQTDYGNHLIWVYGDYADQMEQLGNLLDMEVEVVS
ncbi:MAG: hypothetical protein JSV03_12005 [Planctomycetota bacterium]|nr:MAG: hypothetical protein JSV03_12005 [Planctomycetota bacterium]